MDLLPGPSRPGLSGLTCYTATLQLSPAQEVGTLRMQVDIVPG
jgi:hypothetical protein